MKLNEDVSAEVMEEARWELTAGWRWCCQWGMLHDYFDFFLRKNSG